MGLCGSFRCGCGVTSTPAVSGAVNGELPSIYVSGSGEAGDPYDLQLNDAWAAGVAAGIATPWVPFTPTWANYTRGDGTTDSYKRMVGANLEVFVREVLGATSSVGSSPTMTLPDGLSTLMSPTAHPIGSAMMNDTGTTTLFGIVRLPSATTLDFRPMVASGTYVNSTGVVVNSTTPFTWVATDYFTVHALIPVVV